LNEYSTTIEGGYFVRVAWSVREDNEWIFNYPLRRIFSESNSIGMGRYWMDIQLSPKKDLQW
jgi:hypothetical protein